MSKLKDQLIKTTKIIKDKIITITQNSTKP